VECGKVRRWNAQTHFNNKTNVKVAHHRRRRCQLRLRALEQLQLLRPAHLAWPSSVPSAFGCPCLFKSAGQMSEHTKADQQTAFCILPTSCATGTACTSHHYTIAKCHSQQQQRVIERPWTSGGMGYSATYLMQDLACHQRLRPCRAYHPCHPYHPYHPYHQAYHPCRDPSRPC